MIFGAPIPFAEAIKSRQIREALPTTASSAELEAAFAKLPSAFRDRAMFSARTNNAWYLERVNDIVTAIVSPPPASASEARPAPGSLIDIPLARVKLREALRTIDYQPAEGEAGTLKDLSSEPRLNVLLDTNIRMAQGYGDWQQSQDPVLLDAYPAQELIRIEDRVNPRDWISRWSEAGGELFNGRMIAMKNDPIWEEISRFSLPYAPFDYNSGMDLQDIRRDEALELGVILEDTQIEPQTRPFNDDVEVDPPVRQGNLFTALLESLGSTARFENGVFKLL
jgi:hypothetical protein